MTENPLATAWQDFWNSMSPLRRALWTRSLINSLTEVKCTDERLYHYTAPDAFDAIVTNGKIWASNTAFLNDQGELTYPISLAQEVVAEMLADGSASAGTRELLSTLTRNLSVHALFRSWYTCSFSTEGNLLSQWRAYCPRGGYAVGFDGRLLTEAVNKSREYKFGPVIYERVQQIDRIKNVLMEQVQAFKGARPNFSEVTDDEYLQEVQWFGALALSEEFVFFKAPAFAEEHEWRLARFRFDDGDDILLRERAGLLTPYFEVDLTTADGRLPLLDVYVSPLSDVDLATHSAALVLRRKKFANVDKMIKAPGYRLRY